MFSVWNNDDMIVMEKSELKQEMRNEILQHMEGLAVSGLPQIFRAKRMIRKLSWLTLFLLALGACIFFIYKNIDEYLNYAVATKYRLMRAEDAVKNKAKYTYIYIHALIKCKLS